MPRSSYILVLATLVHVSGISPSNALNPAPAANARQTLQHKQRRQEQTQKHKRAPRPLNVLMFAVDDLRPAGRAYGHPEVLLPNIDSLASRSTVFTDAYAAAATCGVSRSSLLTSRRPDTTQVLSNSKCPFTTQPEHKNWVSLPQYFRRAGYVTAGHGKIFHPSMFTQITRWFLFWQS